MRDFHWRGLTWALVLVPSLALSQAQLIPTELQTLYFPNTHKETGYTPADMVLQDGVGRTVIFEILNLTPYKIHYTGSSLRDQKTRLISERNDLVSPERILPLAEKSGLEPGSPRQVHRVAWYEPVRRGAGGIHWASSSVRAGRQAGPAAVPESR